MVLNRLIAVCKVARICRCIRNSRRRLWHLPDHRLAVMQDWPDGLADQRPALEAGPPEVQASSS